MKQLYLFSLFTLLFLNSCTIQKRTYNRGFAINWNISKGSYSEKTQAKPNNSNNQKEIKTENNFVKNIIVEDSVILQGNVRSDISNNHSDSSRCDLIILGNGDEIYGKVTYVELDVIKYKKCDTTDGPTYSIDRNKVFMIRYSNGTKDVISIIKEPSKDDVPLVNTTVNRIENKTDGFSGGVSAAFALFSIVLLLFETALPIIIITLIIAFAFGIVGLIDSNNSLAMFGTIFSVLTALLLLFLFDIIQ